MNKTDIKGYKFVAGESCSNEDMHEILRRANMYEEMLEALKAAQEFLYQDDDNNSDETNLDIGIAQVKIREAINKAEGRRV